MEFEVSPGFTPHQLSAMKENRQVRVIRSWEGPVPPVTLPSQPGSPPEPMGGRATTPATSVPRGWLSRAGRGLRSLWWVWGHGDSWDVPSPPLQQEPVTPAAAQGPPALAHSLFPAGIPQMPFAPAPAGHRGREGSLDLAQG